MRKNKSLGRIIRIALGIIIFILIYIKIGIENVLEIIKNNDPLFWIPVLILLLISFLIASVNLQILAKSRHPVKFITMLKYYSYSWSIGLLAPGKVGEFSIAYFLQKRKFTLGEGMAIAFIDKIITVIVLCILSIIGSILFFNSGLTIQILIILILFLIITFFLIFNSNIRMFIRKRILGKYEKRFKWT